MKTKKQSKMYRQGDVLVVAIDAIPHDAQPEETNGRIVLAYGEVTGHAHAIDAREAQAFRAKTPVPVFDAQAERFLRVHVNALLKHEEHNTIKLPAGDYAIVTQREYHPEEIRRVED